MSVSFEPAAGTLLSYVGNGLLAIAHELWRFAVRVEGYPGGFDSAVGVRVSGVAFQPRLESGLIRRGPFAMQTLYEGLRGFLFDGIGRGMDAMFQFSIHGAPSCCRRSSASLASPLAKCLFTALVDISSMSATVATFICSNLINISTVRVRTFMSSR